MPNIVCSLVNLYILCIFGRLILSWFPIRPGSPIATVFSFLYTITEPLLGPARRAIPTVGMFDISPILVIFGVRIVAAALGC